MKRGMKWLAVGMLLLGAGTVYVVTSLGPYIQRGRY
jgi:hypothetical protein